MQTCKSDIVMLDQANAKKTLVYTVMQGWEIKHTQKNKKNQKIMHHSIDT